MFIYFIIYETQFSSYIVSSNCCGSACKKDADTSGNYSMTMTIDGKDFSFSDSLAARKVQGSIISLVIDAYGKKDGSFEGFFTSSMKELTSAPQQPFSKRN